MSRLDNRIIREEPRLPPNFIKRWNAQPLLPTIQMWFQTWEPADTKSNDPGWYWSTTKPGGLHGPFATDEDALVDAATMAIVQAARTDRRDLFPLTVR